MVPVPVLRVVRGCQGKAGKVKSHPAAATFNVSLKCGALVRGVRSCIEEYDYLVLFQEIVVEVVPVTGGVVGKVMARCHGCKPFVRLVYKADVCLIVLRGVKPRHAKVCLCHGVGCCQHQHADEDPGQKPEL